MFFYQGHGLVHFRPFSVKRTITGDMIYVYKVNWEDTEPYNVFAKPPVEEVRASHILICGQGDSNCKSNRTQEEALRLTEEIYEKVNETNFAELAEEYSEDPSAKQNSGDLGWFGKGTMVKEFEDAAFALKVGEVSKPIKTQFGYHIIKLTDRKAAEQNKQIKKAKVENNQTKENDSEKIQKEEINKSEEETNASSSEKEFEIKI